ncbi:MAG: T9SS type A sorting domain-containing protein [candidate division Zixibacteria bacterium]|nr:T9SS type A sorting domain-containing protein [candidate division Zixibacteria bacterium]
MRNKRALLMAVFFAVSISFLSPLINGGHCSEGEEYSQELADFRWRQAAHIKAPHLFPSVHSHDDHNIRLCGTPHLMHLADKDLEMPEFFGALSERPDCDRYYDTPAGHFKIHYDTTGLDAPAQTDTNPADGVPDYINQVAEAAEYVWAKEIGEMGYRAPLADDWYPGGGDARYDIYIINQAQGYFGYTQPDQTTSDLYPAYTSFMALDNDYSSVFWMEPLDAMKVTMAHEFFHAIQMSYDATEYKGNVGSPDYSVWWYEVSSVWMEEQVYDNINDYVNYLPYFFNYPSMGLETDGGTQVKNAHKYASCIWGLYLTERFGTNIMRLLWEECATEADYNVISALDTVIAQVSGGTYDLDKAFAEFATWNYFTGDRMFNLYDGTTYSEANMFPEIPDSLIANYSSYPVNVGAGNEVPSTPDFLAANYIKFNVMGDSAGGIQVSFDGHNSAPWEVVLVGANNGPIMYTPKIKFFELNGENQGSKNLRSWTRFSEAVMIPCAVGDQSIGFDATYSYNVSYDPSLLGDEVYVWPGDLDNDGSVGAQEVLSLAMYWHETGNRRTTTGYTWQAQDVILWEDNNNATYADGDGNGRVDIGDFIPILVNWGRTHSGVLNSSSPADGFDVEAYRDVLGNIYEQVRTATSGPQFEIRKYLEDLLGVSVPYDYRLHQNYPNPFNASSVIKYDIPANTNVRIAVYNLTGQLVKVLTDAEHGPGSYEVRWDGDDRKGNSVSSGIYFYRLETSDYSTVKRMALIK